MSIADLPARLPSPLALPLQRYLEESDPRLKLWAMCDSVELLLRLLVFVGIADLAGLPVADGTTARRQPV